MLDPWIIEKIRRREEERAREQERGHAELPVDVPPHYQEADQIKQDNDTNRGVIVIDI